VGFQAAGIPSRTAEKAEGQHCQGVTMDALSREKHTPDPKCCGCGLKPRCTRGSNDVLRLVIVALLLVPVVLMLWGGRG
jgi:hypothetical protein